MSGIEVYIVVSSSFVLGAILGAFFYNCVRGVRAGGPALAPVKAVSPLRAALFSAATYDPPVCSKLLPDLSAWRRLHTPPVPVHIVAWRLHPAEEEMIAPVRRRAHGTGRLGVIDAQTAKDILLRYFDTPMPALPRPATSAVQPGKLIRMPAARASTPVHIVPHSRAS
jgi:hypothetical protein